MARITTESPGPRHWRPWPAGIGPAESGRRPLIRAPPDRQGPAWITRERCSPRRPRKAEAAGAHQITSALIFIGHIAITKAGFACVRSRPRSHAGLLECTRACSSSPGDAAAHHASPFLFFHHREHHQADWKCCWASSRATAACPRCALIDGNRTVLNIVETSRLKKAGGGGSDSLFPAPRAGPSSPSFPQTPFPMAKRSLGQPSAAMLQGKTVLVRVDFTFRWRTRANQRYTRIAPALPTIHALTAKGP